MAFKMKGFPSHRTKSALQQKTGKSFDDLAAEGFSPAEIQQMQEEGATTGEVKPNAKTKKASKNYYNSLRKKVKDGTASKSEKRTLDRLESEHDQTFPNE